MNTPARLRAVRVLFYAALLTALIGGLACAWLLSKQATGAAVIAFAGAVCALVSAAMLDVSQDQWL